MLAIISFINSCSNFNLDFLCLDGSFASCGVVSRVSSSVEILSKFFIGNSLLLKLLGTFSLAVNNNCFSIVFLLLSKLFILAAKLLCSSSASFNDKFPLCISLKKL